MSEKPCLKELSDMCGSEKLHECFKFLNIQEIIFNEVNMRNVACVRDDMRMNVDKRNDRMSEVSELNFDDEQAADCVFHSLHEVQLIERRLVESLASVVADFQRLISLKKKIIKKLEKYDED